MKSKTKIALAALGSFVLRERFERFVRAGQTTSLHNIRNRRQRSGRIRQRFSAEGADLDQGIGWQIPRRWRQQGDRAGGSPPPNRVILLQFPEMDAVKAFFAKQNQLEADVGSKYASFRAIAIEGAEPK